MVVVLILLTVIFSFIDLYLSVQNVGVSLLAEANPLIRFLMDLGGGMELVVLFKLMVTGFFAAVCIKARKEEIAKAGVVLTLAVYLILMLHWKIVL